MFPSACIYYTDYIFAKCGNANLWRLQRTSNISSMTLHVKTPRMINPETLNVDKFYPALSHLINVAKFERRKFINVPAIQ